MDTIGKKIREIRKERKISADSAASSLGISRATLYRYESGDIEKIPADVINKLCKLYGIKVWELLGLSSEQETAVRLDDFACAMYDESRNFSDEDKAQLLAMARYISSKNKK